MDQPTQELHIGSLRILHASLPALQLATCTLPAGSPGRARRGRVCPRAAARRRPRQRGYETEPRYCLRGCQDGPARPG
jgi:hypothetical protein